MFKETLRNSGWAGKLFQLLLFTFMSLMIAMIGVLIWSKIYGMPVSVTSQKVTQLISAVFIFILPVAFLSYFWYDKPFEALHLNKFANTQQILLVIALMVFIQPFINFTTYLNE